MSHEDAMVKTTLAEARGDLKAGAQNNQQPLIQGTRVQEVFKIKSVRDNISRKARTTAKLLDDLQKSGLIPIKLEPE